MRFPTLILLSAMLAGGCATDTIARRKQERLAAFSNLQPNQQLAVEQGRLSPGMSTNAAYIAWGRPSESSSEGSRTTWVYREREFKEEKHITIRVGPKAPGFPEETKTLYARNVVRATIIFEDGQVREWSRTPPGSAQQFR